MKHNTHLYTLYIHCVYTVAQYNKTCSDCSTLQRALYSSHLPRIEEVNEELVLSGPYCVVVNHQYHTQRISVWTEAGYGIHCASELIWTLLGKWYTDLNGQQEWGYILEQKWCPVYWGSLTSGTQIKLLMWHTNLCTCFHVDLPQQKFTEFKSSSVTAWHRDPILWQLLYDMTCIMHVYLFCQHNSGDEREWGTMTCTGNSRLKSLMDISTHRDSECKLYTTCYLIPNIVHEYILRCM